MRSCYLLMEKKIKYMNVLFIGLGSIGQRHMRNLLSLSKQNIRLYALRAKNSPGEISNNLRYNQNINIVKKYKINLIKKIEDLKGINIHISFICNPSSMHVNSAIECAKMKSHIFIEKPLSDSPKKISELKEICVRNKLICFVGFQQRFNPLIIKLKKIINQNTLGKLLYVNANVCEYMPEFHNYEDYRKTYAANKKMGGGVVLSQIHEIDYLQWIFGVPSSVIAYGGKKSNLEIDVEDSVAALLCVPYKKSILPVNLYMDFLQRKPTRNCIVYGTKARLEVDLKKEKIEIYKKNSKKKYSIKKISRNEIFKKEIKNFLSIVKNNTKSPIDITEAKKSLDIGIAIKRSLKENKLISMKV